MPPARELPVHPALPPPISGGQRRMVSETPDQYLSLAQQSAVSQVTTSRDNSHSHRCPLARCWRNRAQKKSRNSTNPNSPPLARGRIRPAPPASHARGVASATPQGDLLSGKTTPTSR